MLDNDLPRIPDLVLERIPAASLKDDKLPKSYSYTADYLAYKKCPRQYMIFRKYGFVPSRSQTMFFGSLVHQTLEDLHNHLIARRSQP
jgi:DNA helicase-2/ATP-dependent DNA helicase PcrA